MAGCYHKPLFGAATLQDLPSDGEGRRFVINASNLQSGALWRFMKPYMRDWRVGEVKSPTIPLATAVAASSAFPPVLFPCVLELKPEQFTSLCLHIALVHWCSIPKQPSARGTSPEPHYMRLCRWVTVSAALELALCV